MKNSCFYIMFSLSCILIFIAGCQEDEEVQSLARESIDGNLPSEYKKKETNIEMKVEKTSIRCLQMKSM